MIDARLGISPINYDKDAYPVFFVNKAVWNDDYIAIIRDALNYRDCYLVVDYDKALFQFRNQYATVTLASLYDLDKVRPMVDVLLGINVKKADDKNEKWKRYYDRWSLTFLGINDKEDTWERVLKKYGSSQPVGKVNIFDALYEYAVRFGEPAETEDDSDAIIGTYSVDGYNISIGFTKNAKITITKQG